MVVRLVPAPVVTPSMGLAHCPLCVALALLSVLRCGAHAVQLWHLTARPAPAARLPLPLQPL
jgi:hypothetical protein